MPTPMPTRRRALTTLAGLALVGTLAACGSSSGTTEATSTSTTPSGPALTVTDGWVKATKDGMTGAFGTLKNTGSTDVVVTGGSSPIAGMVEAHVMTAGDNGQMVMTKAEDGHTVPAGGQLVLEPGGAHLMLMKLKEPVVAGEDYVITVTTKDGQDVDLTFTGREFSGAQEEYDPGMSHDGETSESSPMSSSSH
jgi:copper(I)-binding protein